MPDFTRSFQVGNDVIDVPESKSAVLTSKYPDLKEIHSFTVGNDTLDIPVDKSEYFRTKYPDAKPLQNYNFSSAPTSENPQQFDVNMKIQDAATAPGAPKETNPKLTNTLQPSEDELNANGEWNKIVPSEGQLSDFWTATKHGADRFISAVKLGLADYGRPPQTTMSGIPYTTSVNRRPEDVAKEEAAVQQHKDDVLAYLKAIPEDPNTTGAKIGAFTTYVAMGLASTAMPAIAPAVVAGFYLSGRGEGLEHANDIEKKTKTEMPAWKKEAYASGYGLAMALPVPSLLGRYIAKPIQKYVAETFLKTNPLLVEGLQSTMKSFMAAKPEGIKAILNTGKQFIVGGVHSAAAMESMDLGKLGTNAAMGEDVTLKRFTDGLVSSTQGGGWFNLIMFPFGKYMQNRATTQRRQQQGEVAVGIVGKGPAEIFKTEDGYSAVRPDGTVIKATEKDYDNSVVVPTDVFEQTLKSGKVSPTFERDVFSGRVKLMTNRIADKNGDIHIATDSEGNNFYVMYNDGKGVVQGDNESGQKVSIDPSLPIQKVNKGEVWQGLMNKFDQKVTGEQTQPQANGLSSGPPPEPLSPRDQAEQDLRQFHADHADQQTGMLRKVYEITPGEEPNKTWFVKSEVDGGEGNRFLFVDDGQGNVQSLKKDQIADPQQGELSEVSADDFVSYMMANYDAGQEATAQTANNQLTYEGQTLTRSRATLENGDVIDSWLDDNGMDVDVPPQITAAWDKAKAAGVQNPNILTRTYGKITIAGEKDQLGNIVLSDAMTTDQADALSKEVDRTTGGKSMVVSQPIPSQDTSVPDSYKVSITPTPKVETAPTQQNSTEPKERAVTTQTFGTSAIDIAEDNGFDQVIASDKMPLEKALPILEKKFKDHKKFKLQVEKAQVEIPGETKYDDPTYKTVIKSIKIVPISGQIAGEPTAKEVAPVAPVSDSKMSVFDFFKWTAQNSSDQALRQKASDAVKVNGGNGDVEREYQKYLKDDAYIANNSAQNVETKTETPPEGSVGVGGDVKGKLENEGFKPTLKPNGENEFILQVDDTKPNGKRSVGVIGLKTVEVGGKKFLSIGMTNVREGYEGKGLATNMYRYLMENLPEGYDGILSPKETRWNNEQIPKIHEKLSKEYDKTELDNGDIVFKNKAVEQSLKETSPQGDGISNPLQTELESLGLNVQPMNNGKVGIYSGPTNIIATGATLKDAYDRAKVVKPELFNNGQSKEQAAATGHADQPGSTQKPLTGNTGVKTTGNKPNIGIQKQAYDLETSPTDLRALVFKYFIGGGKLHPDALQELYGNADNDSKKKAVEAERKLRFTWVTKEGATINQIAHGLWEEYGLDHNGEQIDGMTDQDFRDVIEEVINDYISPTQMAIDLIKTYDKKNAEFTDQQIAEMQLEGIINEEIQLPEIQKEIKSLSEDPEINSILADADYHDTEGNIDWNKLKGIIDNDPGHFLQFPYSINEKQLEELKKITDERATEQGRGNDQGDLSRNGEKAKAGDSGIASEVAGQEGLLKPKEEKIPVETPVSENKLFAKDNTSVNIDTASVSEPQVDYRKSNPLGLDNILSETSADYDSRGGMYNSAEYKTANKVQQELKRRGIDKPPSMSQTHFGTSMYFTVYGDNMNVPKLKIRISDHSVKNFDRIWNEQHEKAGADPIGIADDIERAMYPERYEKIQTGVRYSSKYNDEQLYGKLDNGSIWEKETKQMNEKELNNLSPDYVRVLNKEFVRESKTGNQIYKVELERKHEVVEHPVYRYQRIEKVLTPSISDYPSLEKSIRDSGFDPNQVKIITRSEMPLYFRKYGLPNAVDQGNGPVGPRAGSLFIDDQTGQPVAFLPSENNSSDSDVSLIHENQKVYKTQEGEAIQYSLFSDIDNGSGTTNLQRKENREQNPSLRRLTPGEISSVERKYTLDHNFVFSGASKIESTDDVAYLFRQLEHKNIENMFAALIKDGKPIIIHLSMGTVTGTVMNFTALSDAVSRFSPDKVYLIHNHPSGNLEASPADYNIHQIAKELYGNIVGEHIIINLKTGKYATFSYDWDLTTPDRPLSTPNETNYKVIQFDKQIFRENTQLPVHIRHSKDVASFLSAQRFTDGDKLSALILNRKNDIVAYLHLASTDLSSFDQVTRLTDQLRAYIARFGGTSVILSGNRPSDSDGLKQIKKTLKLAEYDLLDYISVDSSSYKSMTDDDLMEPHEPYGNPLQVNEPHKPLGEFIKNANDIYHEKAEIHRSFKEVLEGVRKSIQDRDLPVRRFEEQIKELGGKQNDLSKPYRQLNLSFGRQESLFNEYTEKQTKPIIKALVAIRQQAHISPDFSLPYTIAKHSLERNPKMRQEEAEAIVDRSLMYPTREAIENDMDGSVMDEYNALRDQLIEKEIDKLKDKDYSGVTHFDKRYQDLIKELEVFNKQNPKATELEITTKYKELIEKHQPLSAEEVATGIVTDYEAAVPKALIDQLWKSINSATTHTVNTWYNGGQISSETKDQLINQYKNFIPLRGWQEGDANLLPYTHGEGYSTSLQKAHGRTSLAANPLVYLQKVAFQAIGEQVDFETKKQLLNLVVQNYDSRFKSLYELKKAYYVKTTMDDGSPGWMLSRDGNGDIVIPPEEMFRNGEAKYTLYGQHEKYRVPAKAQEHEVRIHSDKGDVIIVLKGKHLEVAQAINKQNNIARYLFTENYFDTNDWNNPISKTAGAVTNFMKSTMTAYNIVFPLTNFFRDFQEATITQLIRGENGLGVVANYRHAFPALIHHILKTTGDFKYAAYLEEFRLNGGNTGFTHALSPEDIEIKLNAEIEHLLHDGSIPAHIKRLPRNILEGIVSWNMLFEDATRLSVFNTARELGKTPKEAAALAKEASLNFNRKGKLTKAFDGWQAFFNPAIQGAQKYGSLFKHFPKASSLAALAFIIEGYLEALFNDSVPGDKDSNYWNISAYMRQNYFVLPNLPRIISQKIKGEKIDKGNQYLSIPVAQFWRAFKSLGTLGYEREQGRIDTGQMLTQFGSNLLLALSPWDLPGMYINGEFSPLRPFVPTFLNPLVEIATNKNYMGFSISKEPFTKVQEEQLAASGLGKDKVNPVIKFFTDALFRTGGGDNETKYYLDKEGDIQKVHSALDWNPSNLEHLVTGYTAGTGKFVMDVFKTTYNAIAPDKEIDFKDLPFVNAFIRKTPEAKWDIIRQFYDLKKEVEGVPVLAKAYYNDQKYSQYATVKSNSYYNEYAATIGGFDKAVQSLMATMDFKTASGSQQVLDLMQTAIDKVNKIKLKYKK